MCYKNKCKQNMTKLYSPRKLRIGIYTTKNNKIENKQILRWLLLGWLLLGWLLLRWLLLSISADFEQVKNYFADFEQVKKTNSKTPVGETRYLCIFLFRPLPHVTGTSPWLLRPMRVSTSSELYPDTGLFFCFWMHRHPVF